jgi:hypothetical protein
MGEAIPVAGGGWPGRQAPLSVVRLYVDRVQVDFELPIMVRGITLSETARTRPLAGAESDCHDRYHLFFEIQGVEAGDGMLVLYALVDAIRLSSNSMVMERVFAYAEGGHLGAIEAERRPGLAEVCWGHYDEHLPLDSLQFAGAFGPLLCELRRNEEFNRFSNALRLYTSGLWITPSDVALVTLVSALEGLFTTSMQELSYRLALSVASYLERDPQERFRTFDDVREIYTARSKVVHGERLDRNEEQAAIQLVEYYLPTAEGMVRRSLRKMLEDRIEGFVASTRELDKFFTLLTFGRTVPEALKELGVAK